MKVSDVVRITLTVILLIFMCLGYKWALYIIVILITITSEIQSILNNKLIEIVKVLKERT